MLRKFLIPTVIASILILLTTLTSITKATSVTTSTAKTTTTPPPFSPPITAIPPITNTATFAPSSNISATVFQLAKTLVVSKFLNNGAAEETTTSLLPLQPPLNVTSTTLASFILNQKHQQELRQRKQQQRLYLQQQQQQQQQQHQNRQVQDVKETREKQEQQEEFQKHLSSANVNDNKEIIKKNLDSSFVTVISPVDVITAEPSSTHAYLPFDLDYNDPTEEKALKESNARQSTINEVLSNLFPKGFSDIFRFSYAGETETPTTTAAPITVIRSTPTPFKPMPSLKTKEIEMAEMPHNSTFITVSTSVTREIRREISPGHTEIVVEKIITDPGSLKSTEEFRDGSNSISKDELLRINRAAKEASVLPSLLVNPQSNTTNNFTDTMAQAPIVILNENYNNDDFVDAPEDDNQIAESQDVVHQVIAAPPAESTNFHATPTHQYNVRIIHDNTLKNAQDNELAKQEHAAARNSPSYQAFVEQSKYLQNSLKEAPSRRFLKNFQNPILTQNVNPLSVNKGNFHYEQVGAQNHIQTVPPASQLQYVQYQHQQQPQAEAQPQPQQEQYQHLHTQIADSSHLSDKDIYRIDSDEKTFEHTTPANIVFVTINTPVEHVVKHTYSEEPQVIPPQPMKSPHEFVADAMGYLHDTQLVEVDHQAQQTENNPKPSNAGYTFVEVQKSINIHNKLITEKDGRLIEQHETIYPEQKYGAHVQQQQEAEQPHPSPDYISLSQNPIHVEQVDEPYESAASVREEQHALNPAQDLSDFGTIQQSNLIQESHIIETQQQQHAIEPEHYDQPEEEHGDDVHNTHEEEVEEIEDEHKVVEEHEIVGEHLTGEIPAQPVNIPYPSTVQVPYALAEEETYQKAAPLTHLVLQEIVEKHIPVPYGVPEPVGIPVHIQHFIDRPFPVETIVEKPVPYPVEKVIEKVVEKHVPVEVEKIVEKPVEVIVKKYIDRPVAIPIKIPVALHLPPSPPAPYGHYPSSFDHASTWPQTVNGGTFTRVPQNILKAYYAKMLKKLVPQMQQAYKNSHLSKGVPKITPKPYVKPNYKVSDILYDLKPPPPRPKAGSIWDVGARYQYDYNTLPIDLSASSSINVGKNLERPGQGYKTNFDEFQRWRNGHSLKRSPDFGRNLHVEYGFKPPLVPSVEIDDKGVPLKAVADLTKGKE